MNTTQADLNAYENLPDELKSHPQWVVWKLEDNGKPKLDKVPYNPRTGARAKSNDSRTWGTFAEVLAAYQRGGYNGIGFVFTASDPYVGVDLDSCRDPDTGRIEPWAAEITKALDSYTEVSPSSTGVHIIVKAALPPTGRKKGGVEMYDSGRFFTVTGEHIGGTPTTIEERQAEIENLHARIFKPKRHTNTSKANGHSALTDDEILALARKARNGAAFAALWGGDIAGYASQSEADLALCGLLAFYCGPDPARIDGLFRQSGLMRPKWDEKHFSNGRTYGEETIARALSGKQEFYANRHAHDAADWSDLTEDAGIDTSHFRHTDLGNGERLVARYGRDLRYCQPWKKWLAWDGRRWALDDTQQVRQWARTTARAIYGEAEALTARAKDTDDEEQRAKFAERAGKLLQHAVRSESEARLNAMVNLAQMDVPILPQQLDADRWLLNLANGTLNLQTGNLHSHRREDLLTKVTPIFYDSEASCPLWEAFLESVMQGRQDVIDFLWKAVGYSLTGDTREDCLFLLHGTGANGKSTFLNILRTLVGDYGKQAAFSTFLHQDRDAVRNDIADLRGARLVVASEADEGKRLSESLIKSLTGRDLMKARFLFQEYFEFTPQLKLWLAANHKPVIKGTDYAMWRRIRLIPFDVKFEGERQDKELPEKLRAELPGILAWAVRGCLAWQRDGLPCPAVVKAATDTYRTEMDVIGGFLEACCVIKPDAQVTAGTLLTAYHQWSGDKKMSHHKFKDRLLNKGFKQDRSTITGHMVWLGIGLLTTQEGGS